jgi:hypothetical protein
VRERLLIYPAFSSVTACSLPLVVDFCCCFVSYRIHLGVIVTIGALMRSIRFELESKDGSDYHASAGHRHIVNIGKDELQ